MISRGVIVVQESLVQTQWNTILKFDGVLEVERSEMTNPMTGDIVTVVNTHHYLAVVIENGERVGTIRCLEGIGTEIEFEGQGDLFGSLVDRISKLVKGEVARD